MLAWRARSPARWPATPVMLPRRGRWIEATAAGQGARTGCPQGCLRVLRLFNEDSQDTPDAARWITTRSPRVVLHLIHGLPPQEGISALPRVEGAVSDDCIPRHA